MIKTICGIYIKCCIKIYNLRDLFKGFLFEGLLHHSQPVSAVIAQCRLPMSSQHVLNPLSMCPVFSQAATITSPSHHPSLLSVF